eukprot:6108833-Pyramimonas_sp.AAC.1
MGAWHILSNSVFSVDSLESWEPVFSVDSRKSWEPGIPSQFCLWRRFASRSRWGSADLAPANVD